MANFTIPPLNTNPEDDLAYDSLAQTMIAEKRRKAAEVAAALAQSRQSVNDEETAQADAANQKMVNDYTTQLDALAPKAYEMHPQLKEYISNMRAGKDEAAANEKKQNSIYNTLDTLNNIRANEWGFKNVNIGDSGDSAQKAAVEAEKQAGVVGLKDLTGHIDMRRQVAEALARKRDPSNLSRTFLKESKFVTERGKPVMVYNDPNTGISKYFDSNNNPISEDQMISSQKYGMLEGQKIEKDKNIRDNAAKIGVALADYAGGDTNFSNVDRLLNEQTEGRVPRLEDAKIGYNLLTGPTLEGENLPGISVPGFGRINMFDRTGDSTALQATIKRLVGSYQKAISGLTVNAAEAKDIQERLEQNKYASEGEMIRGLKTLQEILRADKEAKLNQYGPEARALYLENQSKIPAKSSSSATGSWGDGQSPQPSPQAQIKEVERVTPNGRKAIYNADTKEFIRYVK